MKYESPCKAVSISDVLHFCHLGLIEYGKAYHLQKKLLHQRSEGEIGDTVLILEHPPTVTIGKSGNSANILVSEAQLARDGIALFPADRGGDVTYHCPGQLVVYPIIDLSNRGKDIRRYIHDLEEVIIRTLGEFSIAACRDKGHPGVWVDGSEIAAIGIRVRTWISMHGFALNVNPEIEQFSIINPCGFSNIKVTSISSILSREIPMEAVTERIIAHFSAVFNACTELRSDTMIWGHL